MYSFVTFSTQHYVHVWVLALFFHIAVIPSFSLLCGIMLCESTVYLPVLLVMNIRFVSRFCYSDSTYMWHVCLCLMYTGNNFLGSIFKCRVAGSWACGFQLRYQIIFKSSCTSFHFHKQYVFWVLHILVKTWFWYLLLTDH